MYDPLLRAEDQRTTSYYMKPGLGVNQLEIMLLRCPHVSREQLALWVEGRRVLWFSMGSCLGFQFCVCEVPRTEVPSPPHLCF